MSKKQIFNYSIFGWLTGLFILPIISHWIGLPSISNGIANLLFYLFGEANLWKSLILILFLFLLVIFLNKEIIMKKPSE